MKNLVTKLSVSVAFILLAFSLALGEEAFQAVENEKIPDILKTIVTQTKQNFERIHTWQGELEASRYTVDKGENAKSTFETMTDAVGSCPNEVAELTSSRVTFKCDLDKGLFYSKTCREKPSRYFDTADGRDLGTRSVTRCSSHIVTNEYQFSAEPSVRRKGEVVQRKAIKDKVDKDCPSCERPLVFDPRDLFDARSPVWLNYPHILERIRQKGEFVVDGKYALKVEQRVLDGDVQYRVQQPAKIGPKVGNIWFIKIFSSSAGYNMISTEMTRADDGKLMHRKSLEYQKVDGVYVPVRSTEDAYDYIGDFSLQVHREDVFKVIRINGVIQAETFIYNNLGLQDGDKFIDKIEGKEYKYQDANLVFVKDLSAPASSKQGTAVTEPNK